MCRDKCKETLRNAAAFPSYWRSAFDVDFYSPLH